MYVESIALENFRCYTKAETHFSIPNGKKSDDIANVTLLLGVNGAGKTSLLKSVSLTVLSPIFFDLGYRPYYVVRRRAPHEAVDSHSSQAFLVVQTLIGRKSLQFEMGFLTVNHEDNVLARTITDLSEEKSLFENEADFFMLGYGASRRTEYIENLDSQRSKRRHPRFQRVAGLFEEFITLYPLAAWYPSIKSKVRAKEILTLINGLLPERTRFTGECKDGEGIFEHEGIELPFGVLSDGYRSFVGLIADMLYHMHTVSPKKKLTELEGLVMIDDIDVHLHPGWQRDVVPSLAKTFPKLQFIITTHSPLVVGSVKASNIRVVEDNQIRQYVEETDGRTADQILVSSYFGMNTTRSRSAEKRLKQKAKRVADTHDPQEAIAYLHELSGRNGKP